MFWLSVACYIPGLQVETSSTGKAELLLMDAASTDNRDLNNENS
jgi:hypothetical protein